MKTCSFEGCGRAAKAIGLCRAHYDMQARGSELRPIKTYRRNKGRTCSLSGCGYPARGKGFCRAHLDRYNVARKTGKLDLGHWKSLVRSRRIGGTVGLTARWPKAKLKALETHAERRGLPRARALVELALLALAGRAEAERTAA